MMTKVQYTTQSEDWNWHRHDMSHLARFVEKKWEKHVTTQSVNLAQASVEDLLLSPVLFISGKDSPCPKDSALRREFGQKLRDYIDRGGFIIAEAVAPGGTFDAGMRKLLREIFPEEEQHLYPMPPEHPIWSAEVAIPPKYVRPVYCLDYGCRTCLLFLPGEVEGEGENAGKRVKNPRPSLSCLWELAPEMRQGRLHSASVKQEIQAGMNLGLNILAYVTERKLRSKEENFVNYNATDSDASTVVKMPDNSVSRGCLSVANIRHGGGCEATPKALENLLKTAVETLGIPSGVQTETLPLTSSRIFEFPTLFMQGRYAFRFTSAEREQLRTYLDRGGLLLVNSICGSEAFHEAFLRELAQVSPGATLEEIPLSDALCSPELGGFDLAQIRTRPEKNGNEQALRLMGLRYNGRWAVIYSPLDLSCALEQHPSAGCHGYSPENATKIGLNVILYALQ